MDKYKILLLILTFTLSGCDDGFINNKITYGLKLEKPVSIECVIKSLNKTPNISDIKLKSKNITFRVYGYSSKLTFNSNDGKFLAYEINVDGMFKFESFSTFSLNAEKVSRQINSSIRNDCLN